MESEEPRSHAVRLTPLIEDILKEAGIKAADLEAVAVSRGPGSFTGLRIGVSTAKGIAYGASVPLIGIDTTLSMFHGFYKTAAAKYGPGENDIFCPVIDARRMEVYYSVYDSPGKNLTGTGAAIIDKDFPAGHNDSPRIFIFGDAAAKCREVIRGRNVIIDDEFRLSASYLGKPAYEAFDEKRFEDVAYFEPFYLKDFLATRPVKNILGN
jgi:tRNA threonylcarbamoyladenosine biosynthesis protein TsaB